MSSFSSSGFHWTTEDVSVEFVLRDNRIGVHRVAAANAPGSVEPVEFPASLVEIRTVGEGSNGGHYNLHTSIGDRLEYRGHTETDDEGIAGLRIDLEDPATGIAASVTLTSRPGAAAITANTTVTNGSSRPHQLLTVSAFVLETPLETSDRFQDFRLHWARNDWTRECRWEEAPVVDLLVPDKAEEKYSIESRRPFGKSGLGTWSSGHHLPMGMLEDQRTGFAVAWQLENPGPWRWEVGHRRRSLAIGAFGPTDFEHQWLRRLEPGESFTGPDVTFAFGQAGWESAVHQLNLSRRLRRTDHPSFRTKPVVYNDFFALLGEPSEQNLAPLIDAAADLGVEVFCIDAGWFSVDEATSGLGAEGGHSWWDSLGDYEESTARFPHGLSTIASRIRDRGMIPGIWMEPEVVGVNSPVARRLPDEAFFLRNGERVVEHGRYQIDLSHPAGRAYADEAVDRVLTSYGFGYLKVDYNINPGAGTDGSGTAPGEGLWRHSRAVIDWFSGLQQRHPDVIIMNCASGGMRMDGATQRITHVQQMSDQSEALPFAQIAVAAPTMIPPDQAASWMDVGPSTSLDLLRFAGVAPQLSRFELAGHIADLSPDQKQVVLEAVGTYKKNRDQVGVGEVIWPWGLPGFADPWLTVAHRSADATRLALWRRSGEDDTAVVELPWLARRGVSPVVTFPEATDATIEWSDEDGVLRATLRQSPAAVLLTFA